MSTLNENLDETIAAAVKAQVQAKVLEALSGNDFFGKYVHSILHEQIEIVDPRDRYKKIKTTMIDNAITGVIKKAIREALEVAVIEERDRIQDEVRKAVKRRSEDFAVAMTDELLKNAANDWRFNIALYQPKRES